MDYPVAFINNGRQSPYPAGYELLGVFSAIVLPDAYRRRNKNSKRRGRQGTG